MKRITTGGHFFIFALAAVLLLSTPTATAQTRDTGDAFRARAIGVLKITRLRVEFDQAPAREVFAALSETIGLPILGKYDDDRAGFGIDPETPIVLSVDDASALRILELTLEQCAIYEQCTWQLRAGAIEVGTKERLSARGSEETRTYDVSTLLLEAPLFIAPSPWALTDSRAQIKRAKEGLEEHPFRTASVQRDIRTLQFGKGPWEEFRIRNRKKEIREQLVRLIIETIEPGNWHFRPEDVGEEPSGSNEASHNPADAANKIARIRFLHDNLVISAPDFIHRQVAGYPKPIAPAPLTKQQRDARSNAASRDRIGVVVLETRRPTTRETTK